MSWLQSIGSYENFAANISDTWASSVNEMLANIFSGNTETDQIVEGKSNFSSLSNALDNGLLVIAPTIEAEMIEGALVSHMIPLALLQNPQVRPFIMYVTAC